MLRPSSIPGLQNAPPKPLMQSRGAAGGGRQRQAMPDGSLNHLLGFTLPPRQRPSAGPRRSAKRPGHVAYSRDRFVHAQYRFLLKPTGDFTAHFADPDIYFHWPDVLQVIVPTTTALPSTSSLTLSPNSTPAPLSCESFLCPICLSTPTAPRMTKCGHIFCYPCLLHYLEVGDEGKGKGIGRKCPVCGDTVLRKDLKSVKWFDPAGEADKAVASTLENVPVIDRGNVPTMTFRLIQRPDITTLALPRSATWPSDAIPPHLTPWHFTPDALTFARFSLAAPEYLTASLQHDLTELALEEKTLLRWSGADDLGVVFVKAAEKKVREQLEKAMGLKTTAVMTARKRALKEIAAVEEKAGKSDATAADVGNMTTTDEEGETSGQPTAGTRSPFSAGLPLPPAPSVADLGASIQSAAIAAAAARAGKPRRNLNPPATDANYYFYQAASGQPFFLHPLDIRILKAHFGRYESFPDTIVVPVEGYEEGSMNDEVRRRCKYLGHIPTGGDVVFVETGMEDIVGQKGQEAWMGALKQRRGKRKDKAKREEKARVKWEGKEREANAATYALHSTFTPSAMHPFDSHALGHSDDASSEASSPPLRPSSMPARPTPAAPPARTTAWGSKSTTFASTLSSASHGRQPALAEDYEHAWAEFEEDVVLRGSERGARGRRGGSASGSAGGADHVESAGPPGSGKKGRKKKVVLNLSGGGGRRGA